MNAEIKNIVTQADVAHAAGVSQGTVSAVLGQWSGKRLSISPDLSERIRNIADDLGYRANRAAQQLRGRPSRLLAILIGRGSPPVLFDRLRSLEDEASRRGYRVMVVQIDRDLHKMKQHIDDLTARGVDGIICMSHEYYADSSYVPQMLSKFSRVLYLRRPAIETATWIHIDGASCIYQAIDHLKQQGRRRICIQIADEVHLAYVDRLNAYLDAMHKYAPELGRELVWVCDYRRRHDPQDPSEVVANAVVEKYIVKGKADSIILTNDNWAAMMIKVLKRRGVRIPEDVAVIGQGNFLVGSLIDPELTTLDPCTEKFAQAAVNILVSWIEQNEPVPVGEVALIKPKLIVRAST